MFRFTGLLLSLLLVNLVSADPAPSTDDTRLVELQTAGYYELVARAKELGLPVTGGVSELRDRVAQAIGVVLPPAAEASDRTLTIDSAQEAGLVDVDAPGDGKLLRLSGGLHVTLVDNGKKVTHVIEAGELWYDQANEEMTARGNVVYTMIRESSREVFRGESLTFRLSDSQGVFYGGASDRSRAVGDQNLVFRYQGDAIRRSNEDLIVLETGTITSSLGTDPYYRIRAKKIWVLAPGEWGLQDAVLYLGRIPVLYFPFFFQPGDDFFFNPVLSFPEAGDRRGTSLQTTTYFLGKKKRDTAPLSFLQLEDSTTKDTGRVQKGLFLVRGKVPKTDIPDTWTLRLLADFYSNLGFLTAVDGTVPGWLGTKSLSFLAGVGVTRTVDTTGGTFSQNPFQPLVDPWAQSHWNGSWLGSWRLPFRWGGSFSTETGPAALSLEYYSDPLLANDLTGNRSENFSVFSLLGLGPAKKTVAAAAKSSLQWTGSFNLNPVATSASLLWDSKAATPAGLTGDPENNFYVPSQLTLPQLSLNLGGTLWPPTAVDPAKPKTTTGPELLPPDADANPEAEVPPTVTDWAAPARMDSLASGTSGPEWTTGANWSLKPTVKTDTRFDTSAVNTSRDSPWTVQTSRWSGAYDGRLAWTTGWTDGTWTTNQAFNLHQQTQNTWYLAPSVAASQSTAYDLQDQQATSSLLTQTLGSLWKPWAGRGAWRDSSLQYNLATKLWEQKTASSTLFDATKNTVTAHDATAQAVWYLWEGAPTIKAQAGWQSSLPPLDPLRTWSSGLDVSMPWGKANTKASAKQTATSLTWDPWESNAEWTPWTALSLKENFQYDLQAARPLSSTAILAAWGWSAQYRQQRTTPYRFDTSTHRWVVAGDQDFLPQELRFSYTLDLPSVQWWYWRNSLSSKVNFSWPITLQQFTQMPLSLDYTVTYKLYRFLDLQVTESVQNKTAYRYFPFLTDALGPGVVSSVNPLTDLWDAVSIWDQKALHRTGFKMARVSVGLVHYLDDWSVKLDYSGSPQLTTVGTQQQFQWVGTLTILVQWYPVPELKTQMQWDKDGTLSILKNSQ